MIKTKAIWKFFYHCLFYNYLFILTIILLLVLNVALGVVFNLLVNNDLLKFNKWAFIFIQASIVFALVFIVSSVFFLFNVVKNNDMQAFLMLSPYSRSKLFIQKNLFIFTCFLFFAILNLAIQIILSIAFGNDSILLLSSVLFGLSIAVFLIFEPLIVLLAITSKSVLFVLGSGILILLMPVTFFVSRFISPLNQKDYLSYDLAHNQNNYVKMNVLNEKQNIEEQYLLGIKSYDERANQNLAPHLNDSINPIKNSFAFAMVGDIFNQVVADLLPKPTYTQEELYQLSTENYIFNLNLITTSSYLTGDPSELNELSGSDIAYIAYQDQDPFEMTYEQILSGIIKVINKLDLSSTANTTFINSIFEKTAKDISWTNVKFSEKELNILQTLAGKNDSWLFYFLKYKDFLSNKTVNLFKDITNIYGNTIGEFSKFLWQENKFTNNVIKYQNILEPSFIHDNFPDIGTIDIYQKANDFDVNYFKNTLVHFNDIDETNTAVKVLTATNGYEEINLELYENNKLFEYLKSYQTWSDYIDLHSEIVDLEIIYDQLFTMNQYMYPDYRFKNNESDFYAVNKILNIESKSWINNSWLTIAILLAISFIIASFTYLLNAKKGAKYA